MKILLVEDSEEEIQKALAIIHSQFPGTRLTGADKSEVLLRRAVFCDDHKSEEAPCTIYIAEDQQSAYLFGEMRKLDLVVTDLMIPNQSGDGPMPHGLSILIRASRAGVIVALATSENHHQCSFVPAVVSLLSSKQQARFFYSTKKDWVQVITATFKLFRA